VSKVTKFLLAVIGCELVGIITTPITTQAIPTWYANLEKPFFSPPNLVFGPLWTILYFLIGTSLFLIWETKEKKKEKTTALTYFAIQLVLNLLWTPIFFGLQSPIFGLITILLLVFFIIRTMQSFMKLSPIAAWLLIPYLLWVSFATLLNASIVFLNS
jgi:translocator protein